MKNIFIISFLILLTNSNLYAEDIKINKTKNHYLTAKPINEHFMTSQEIVRAGVQSQKFYLPHGSCNGQDCKWSAQRTERELKLLHKSKKKLGNPVYYAWSIFFPDEFDINWTGSKMIVGQVKMKGVGMPIWEIHTRGAGFNIIAHHSINKAKFYCGKINKGEWTDIIIKADYAKEKSLDNNYKFFETWINGEYKETCSHNYPIVKEKTFKESNSNVGNSAGKVNFRYGIYRPNVGRWLERKNANKPEKIDYFNDPDGGERVITHPFKLNWEVKIPAALIYYDEIRVGNSKDQVDISKVNKPVD
tara:strand:+ start:177 stop:1088 length:912 start_codon:yes stop_codon:yes gene_type:complete